MCSTPFGIIGIFTMPAGWLTTARMCAQRLSASLESSPAGRAQAPVRHLVLNAFRHHWNLHPGVTPPNDGDQTCSTPFGIIGIFTRDLKVNGCAVARVLNAFRHHWNLHSARDQHLPLCTRGAQRLSASLESSPRRLHERTRGRPCAQRLSASLESSQWHGSCPPPRLIVLNAFRHHWNLHLVEGESDGGDLWCSTPFGIIGIFTRVQ